MNGIRLPNRTWDVRLPLVVLCGLSLIGFRLAASEPIGMCRMVVVDEDSGWAVPLVELRTTNGSRFISDNAGVIALDDPTLMNRDVWFTVLGHGYSVAADGFGNRGVRLRPKPGASLKVQVKRTSIAKRIGRLTGAGLFAESQKLGDELDWRDGTVFGCDSVQNAVHGGKMYWAWGDTHIARYPLGIFHTTSATTSLHPLGMLEPPVRLRFDYFVDQHGAPRAVAEMPGDGPTWLTGYVSLPDKNGTKRLVAAYRKIKPPLDVYEAGLCVWNEASEAFEHLRISWTKTSGDPRPPLAADGHPVFWSDESGKNWLLLGNPFPAAKVAATFEDWQDSSRWQRLSPQATVTSAGNRKSIEPHSGSIAWSEYRTRWVTVFTQRFGKPSAFGTLWYAEADSPFGPWGPAVQVLAHDNYTFYNPRLHPEFTARSEAILLFEGTYSAEFAEHPLPTPRYNYNQILYRLDLDEPSLRPAHASP